MPQTPEEGMIAQAQPTGVNIPTSEQQRTAQLWDDIMVKYRKRNTDLKEILDWVEQDREKLQLDAKNPVPEWTPQDRADMDKWLLAIRVLVDKQYKENKKRNKWWRKIGRGIAWGPTILMNAVVFVLTAFFN